ncbi:paraquat-inducible membrane protein A [Lichenicola cladoniae]|uniref:Paraquat-inducible membrane protein A n=1 Tax=Lichenicola cladoniae TaxID=1484109 RepID=A0A6M8HLA2_9PROT|nr:paraquat-inducible protein A [Lichenicola cladoniae]NPD68937.1 paraquat-inducible membrane protein A [Acetobacteraceae bacterium]QKE89117.1 paraquat-inducible membrane protein A [Lichenicola cladoniae]
MTTDTSPPAHGAPTNPAPGAPKRRGLGRRLPKGFKFGVAKTKRPSLRLHVLDGLSECPSCGFFQQVPRLQPGQVADCKRCHGQIGRRRTNPPVSTPLAFCLASAVLYFVAITHSLLTFDLYGRTRTVSLLTGPGELWREGWGPVGVLVLLATVVIPPIVIGLMLAILTAASRPKLPRWAPGLMRRYERLRPWSMIEVYMLGVFVAYTKLIDLAHIEVGVAVYALAGLMLTMAATDSTLDVERVWHKRPVARFARRADGTRVIISTVDASEMVLPPARRIVSCTSCGLVCAADYDIPQERVLGNCPRCQAKVRRRKPQGVLRCMLLTGSAVILYIPANLYPVMTIIQVGRGGGHTILAGVRELYEAHMLPLALLVFFASITVPVLKIVGLTMMAWCTWRGSATRLIDRGRLFRIIDAIGRWSMIDVFMISILVAIVHLGRLANISAEPGVFAFASVVVLTIFAADCFDPRLMWDAAGMNGVLLAKNATGPKTTQGGGRQSVLPSATESVGA